MGKVSTFLNPGNGERFRVFHEILPPTIGGFASLRTSLSDVSNSVWSALKEFEGAQLEIDSAAVTGITEKQKRAATKLRNENLADIEALMGPDTRKKVENGGLDDIRDKFIQKQKAKQKAKQESQP